MNCLVNIDGFTSFYLALYVTKRVIEREQSIMGTIFFIFKVNTEGPFPINPGHGLFMRASSSSFAFYLHARLIKVIIYPER